MSLVVDFAHKPTTAGASAPPLSTTQPSDISSVLNRMRKTALALLSAEIQLAKTELQEEFTAEVLFTRRIILASALIITGATLLLFGVLIVISKFMPLWLATTITGAVLLGGGVASLTSAWKRHASISTIATHLKDSLDLSDLGG